MAMPFRPGPPAIRRLCLAVDIESYSSRSTPEQVDLQDRLAWATAQACHATGVRAARCDHQVSGDGKILILPPGVDERKVLPGLVRGLLSTLRVVNRNPGPGGPMRLRVSLGQGVIQVGATGFASHAVIVVARLLDSAELRAALKDNQRADAALIVTADLFDDLFAQGYGGLPPDGFRKIRVDIPAKKFSDAGWIAAPADPPLLPGIPSYKPSPNLPEIVRRLLAGGQQAGAPAAAAGAAAGLVWATHAGGHPRSPDPLTTAVDKAVGDHQPDAFRPSEHPEAARGRGSSPGRSWAAGHRGQDHRDDPPHPAAGGTRHADLVEPLNADAAVRYDLGESKPGTGVAGRAAAVEAAYGYTVTGNTENYTEEFSYSSPAEQAAGYEQVEKIRTPDGYELKGYREAEVRTRDREVLEAQQADYRFTHDKNGGHDVTGGTTTEYETAHRGPDGHYHEDGYYQTETYVENYHVEDHGGHQEIP